MSHWNLINFSLADLCREFGYTYKEIGDGDYHVLDADGLVIATGKVWELWEWFGRDVGI